VNVITLYGVLDDEDLPGLLNADELAIHAEMEDVEWYSNELMV